MTTVEPASAASTAPAAEVDRRAWWGLGLGAVANLVVSLNVSGTNIAFPAIEAAFPETSRATLSWVISGYGIGLAAFLLIGGRLADRLGRRRVLIGACAGFLVALVLTALAIGPAMLITMRFAQSVAAAFALPASLATSLPDFPSNYRGRVVALWAAAGTVGAALGPTLAAVAVELFSWRAVYLLGVPLLALVIVAAPRLLHESKAPTAPTSLDWAGVAMGTVAIAAVVFAVSQSTSLGWASPWVVGALALFALLTPAFLWRCRVHPEPLLNLDVFKLRTVWSANLTNMFLSMSGLSAWLVWPLYLTGVWGYSSFEAGVAITPGPVNAFIFSLIAGRLVDRYGPRGLISIGILFPVAGTVFYVAFSSTEPAYFTHFLPGILLFSTGFGLSFAPLNTAALAGVPEAVYGQVNAAFNMMRYLAAAIGVAAVVAVLGDSVSVAAFDRAYILLAVLALFALLTVVFTYPRRVPNP